MILFAPGALEDLERIFDFYAATAPQLAREQLARIREAIQLLDRHPLLGRVARAGSTLRELVISSGKTGFVALYARDRAEGLIRVVAIRHQREVGYRDT